MIVVDALPDAWPPAGSVADPLWLDWDAREKTRQRARTQGSRELAIKLPTGTRLPPGTVVWIGAGVHVEIAAASEDLWVVACGDAGRLARVAYEIGNRHLPIAIGAATIAVRYDHTLADVWRRFGVTATRARLPFLAERPPVGHVWDPPQRIRSA